MGSTLTGSGPCSGWPRPKTRPKGPVRSRPPLPQSAAFRSALNDASLKARSIDRTRPVGTEHLLAGLLAGAGPAADVLTGAGMELRPLLDRLFESETAETAPIPMSPEIPPLDLTEPSQAIDLGRILDASANRASEGLRVIEDYVRFTLDDPALTKRLKEIRHRLGEAIRGLDPELLIGGAIPGATSARTS